MDWSVSPTKWQQNAVWLGRIYIWEMPTWFSTFDEFGEFGNLLVVDPCCASRSSCLQERLAAEHFQFVPWLKVFKAQKMNVAVGCWLFFWTTSSNSCCFCCASGCCRFECCYIFVESIHTWLRPCFPKWDGSQQCPIVWSLSNPISEPWAACWFQFKCVAKWSLL